MTEENTSAGPAWTPGHWRVEEGTTLVWGASDPDDRSSYGMGVPVAEAVRRSDKWAAERHPIGDDEWVANARLISAAPDLYEALAVLVAQAMGSASYPGDAALFLAVEAADNALAKARGESK